MSGHNVAPSTFEKVLPEIVEGMLGDIAAYGAGQGRKRALDSTAIRTAERAFCASMRGLYAHLERELERLDKAVSEMSAGEREDLANRLAAGLKGG